jgi:hypothetical protein
MKQLIRVRVKDVPRRAALLRVHGRWGRYWSFALANTPSNTQPQERCAHDNDELFHRSSPNNERICAITADTWEKIVQKSHS